MAGVVTTSWSYFSVRIVVLVADEDSVNDVAVLVDLVEPALHIGKALPAGHVVHNDHPVGPPVVGAGDGPEPGRGAVSVRMDERVSGYHLSWPAVSQICSLTLSPWISIVRILKSTPMVVI